MSEPTFEPFIALVVDGDLKWQSLAFETGFSIMLKNEKPYRHVTFTPFTTYYAHMVHAGSFRYMVASTQHILPVEIKLLDMLIESKCASLFRTDMFKNFADSSYHNAPFPGPRYGLTPTVVY